MNDHIQKMHQARRDARDEAIWEAVQTVQAREHCKCDLRQGMTREALPGGSGCRDSYVCPALDTYRRMLPPTELPEEERALQESV